ncbi:MAG: hypothetical protein VW935_18760 [Novosphingobium sp.]
MDDRVGQFVIIDHDFERSAPDPTFASLSRRRASTAFQKQNITEDVKLHMRRRKVRTFFYANLNA